MLLVWSVVINFSASFPLLYLSLHDFEMHSETFNEEQIQMKGH